MEKEAIKLRCAKCKTVGNVAEFYPNGHARCPACGSKGHYVAVFPDEAAKNNQPERVKRIR